MKQDVDSGEAWRRHTGPTPSDNTGPSQAFKGSYYIYMEGSEQVRAVISTPPLLHSGDMCVRFHYSIYGQFIDSFTVFLESQRQGSPILKEPGDRENNGWYSAAISVNNFSENDRLTFISKSVATDPSLRPFADTAIDDLRITAGECNACDVNNGDCDHICHKDGDDMRCDCNYGYKLDGDRRRCIDVDECSDGTSGCSDVCDNSPGGYSCTCPSGYYLMQDQKTCEDIDECSAVTDNCAQTCVNTAGSLMCVCRAGYETTDDGQTCTDIDECRLGGHGCHSADFCENIDGSYTCSCPDALNLQEDGRTCSVSDCQAAYQKTIDSMQAFSTDCPNIETYTGVSLQTCLLEACHASASVVAFVNKVCSLKRCPEGDLQLSVGVAGWDIYVLNVTRSGEPSPAPSTTQPLAEGFPLWQVLVGVFIGIAVIVAVVVGVIFGRRTLRRRSPAKGPVQYENSPLDTVHTDVPNPELPADKEAGVYSEITEASTNAIPGDRDNRVLYQNSAFQGEEPYQGLGPTDPRDTQPYQAVN